MRTTWASPITWTAVLALLAGAAQAAPPHPVILVLGGGEATATPCMKKCCSHAGGGNITVSQPAPDTIVVHMTGVVVAAGHPFLKSVASYHFDLSQCFEVVFVDPNLKQARLTLEGRVVGLLRSPCCCKKCGVAEISEPASASVVCGPDAILSIALPCRSACGEDLSVYNREGPHAVSVLPGEYRLHGTWGIRASHGYSPLLCKGPSAEFAPDPALDSSWISHKEPFHGAAKRDFGFQFIVRVLPD